MVLQCGQSIIFTPLPKFCQPPFAGRYGLVGLVSLRVATFEVPLKSALAPPRPLPALIAIENQPYLQSKVLVHAPFTYPLGQMNPKGLLMLIPLSPKGVYYIYITYKAGWKPGKPRYVLLPLDSRLANRDPMHLSIARPRL